MPLHDNCSGEPISDSEWRNIEVGLLCHWVGEVGRIFPNLEDDESALDEMACIYENFYEEHLNTMRKVVNVTVEEFMSKMVYIFNWQISILEQCYEVRKLCDFALKEYDFGILHYSHVFLDQTKITAQAPSIDKLYGEFVHPTNSERTYNFPAATAEF